MLQPPSKGPQLKFEGIAAKTAALANAQLNTDYQHLNSFEMKNKTSKSKISKLTESQMRTICGGGELTKIVYYVDGKMFIIWV